MLSDKIREYKTTGKMLKNTPAMYKKEHPFLKEVDSLALANVQLHLEKAAYFLIYKWWEHVTEPMFDKIWNIIN